MRAWCYGTSCGTTGMCDLLSRSALRSVAQPLLHWSALRSISLQHDWCAMLYLRRIKTLSNIIPAKPKLEITDCVALLCFALLCVALVSLALLSFALLALLSIALRAIALLCFACFALLCFTLLALFCVALLAPGQLLSYTVRTLIGRAC